MDSRDNFFPGFLIFLSFFFSIQTLTFFFFFLRLEFYNLFLFNLFWVIKKKSIFFLGNIVHPLKSYYSFVHSSPHKLL